MKYRTPEMSSDDFDPDIAEAESQNGYSKIYKVKVHSVWPIMLFP